MAGGGVCAEACESARCNGDACDNPIVVSGSGTYTGDGDGYGKELDFAGNASCDNRESEGYEVVFLLPNLQAGNVVSIDAATNDTNLNAIFISQACGDTVTAAADHRDRS